MEEIILDKIEWTAAEYKHEDKSVDFLWGTGLVAVVLCIIAIWMNNYLFAVFILLGGASLLLFSVRPPEIINYTLETSGLFIGKDKYPWKNLKGFHIAKEEGYTTLLILTDKYFLPVYTIPLPEEKSKEVRDALIKVIPNIEIAESQSMKFMEKIGF